MSAGQQKQTKHIKCMLKYKYHVSAMRTTILLIHHITFVCVTADFRKTTDNSKFFSLPFHPQDSLLSTTKMSWFENWEPVHSFTETVRVGRGSSYLNVIIRYNNPGFGRGGNLSLLLNDVCAKLGLLKRYRTLHCSLG